MRFTFLLLTASLAGLAVAGCQDDTTVQTSELIVRYDDTAPFETYDTFSVLTSDLVPDAPEPGEDEDVFNDLVNQFIIDAMQAEPVCLTFIPPEEVDENNTPDVFAGNGVAVRQEEGVVWQCIGGWWWGYWGWYWDPCKWIVPVPVDYDVGSMLIPVGPPPEEGEDARPVFAGLAQSLVAAGIDEEQVRNAVNAIFSQWPDPRTCSSGNDE